MSLSISFLLPPSPKTPFSPSPSFPPLFFLQSPSPSHLHPSPPIFSLSLLFSFFIRVSPLLTFSQVFFPFFLFLLFPPIPPVGTPLFSTMFLSSRTPSSIYFPSAHLLVTVIKAVFNEMMLVIKLSTLKLLGALLKIITAPETSETRKVFETRGER